MFEIASCGNWWDTARHYEPLKTIMMPVLKSVGYTQVISAIEKYNPRILLEIGHGHTTPLFKLYENKVEMWGIDDYSGTLGSGTLGTIPTDIVNFRKKYTKCKFVVGLLGNENENELPKNHFDFICSVSVLEHIPESSLNEVFKQIYNCLKPGGVSLHTYDVCIGQPVKAMFDANENAKLQWLKPKKTMNVFWEEWLHKWGAESDREYITDIISRIAIEDPRTVMNSYMAFKEEAAREWPSNFCTILVGTVKPYS